MGPSDMDGIAKRREMVRIVVSMLAEHRAAQQRELHTLQELVRRDPASGSTAVKNTRCTPQGYYWGEGIEDHGRVASSSVIMRKGCHYAQYTLAGPSAEALFGVIRPNYCSPADIERHSSAAGKRRSHSDQGDASDDIEHCFYYARNGTLYPGVRILST